MEDSLTKALGGLGWMGPIAGGEGEVTLACLTGQVAGERAAEEADMRRM